MTDATLLKRFKLDKQFINITAESRIIHTDEIANSSSNKCISWSQIAFSSSQLGEVKTMLSGTDQFQSWVEECNP